MLVYTSKRVHLAGCPLIKRQRRARQETFDNDDLAPCRRCLPSGLPLCLVCASEAGAPTGCQGNHGLCEECLETHLQREGFLKPHRLPKCPCGDSPIDLKGLPSDALETWVRSRSPAASARASDERWSSASMCAEARRLSCPHCGRTFVEFDGCLALRCVCEGWFCALCLRAMDGDEGAHDHVRKCPLNPTGSLYLPLEQCRSIWLASARRKLKRSLAHVRESDGGLLEYALSRAILRRDAEVACTDATPMHPLWYTSPLVVAGFVAGWWWQV